MARGEALELKIMRYLSSVGPSSIGALSRGTSYSSGRVKEALLRLIAQGVVEMRDYGTIRTYRLKQTQAER